MTATADNGWELSVTRFINATPEKVWEIMTKRITEWWCPKPWTTEILEMEWRAGGRTSVMMRGPAGEESPHEGIFLEVTPGVRFVSTDAFIFNAENGFTPKDPFMVGCWEIVAEGNGTRYTATARHWDEATTKRHQDMGFAQGWGVCADQLKDLAESL